MFDLLVIGGGINGAGIARDAALRGLSVCLLERDDFGGGTTAASTRLIHGGLRYLQHGELALVRESLREREILLRVAPHLVRPLSFLLPVYEHSPHRAGKLRLGLSIYDLLSYDRSLPAHRALPAVSWHDEEPHLDREGLRALLAYSDAQVAFPERLCWENVLSAAEHGAVVANHTEVVGLLRDGARVTGVAARDRLTGDCSEIRARAVINAAGPWVDRVNRGIGDRARRRIAAMKGSHLVAPRREVGPKHAIYSPARRDGRPFFIIPWNDALLIGTTEVPVADVDEGARCSPEERAYLLSETNALYPALRLRPEEIHYTYAGLRPLPASRRPASARTRRHFVIDHTSEGAPGLLSIIGGKITTYRALAAIAVDAAVNAADIRRPSPSRTNVVPLPGGDPSAGSGQALDDFARFRAQEIRAGLAAGLPETTAAHLVDLYGALAPKVRALAAADPEFARPLCPHTPMIVAQVRFAVEAERARILADVLLRRAPVGLGPCLGRDAAPAVARIMAPLLGWGEARVEMELAAYDALVESRLP